MKELINAEEARKLYKKGYAIIEDCASSKNYDYNANPEVMSYNEIEDGIIYYAVVGENGVN